MVFSRGTGGKLVDGKEADKSGAQSSSKKPKTDEEWEAAIQEEEQIKADMYRLLMETCGFNPNEIADMTPEQQLLFLGEKGEAFKKASRYGAGQVNIMEAKAFIRSLEKNV